MKQGIVAIAEEYPQKLSVRKLYGDIYELYATDNVNEVVMPSEDEQPHTQYEYAQYGDTKAIRDYDELVAALVGLKYTYADEIALLKKGIADALNSEYLAYTEYVAECKAFAKQEGL